jgi:acetyl esterase/lipase
VVIIHAIGKFAKERKFYLPEAAKFAQKGYVGVVIGYRHLPEVAYPAAIDDAKTAIRWLRTHAANYKIDPDRIAALGYSGGGALACLLGMEKPLAKMGPKGEKEPPSSRVQAVIAYYPPTDFARLHEDCGKGTVPFPQGWLIGSSFETWLGGTPKKVPNRYKEASPIHHAHQEVAPILLIHGMADTVVPFTQSQILAEKIAQQKGRVTLLGFAGAGHGFDEGNGPHAQLTEKMTQAFLAEYLPAPTANKTPVARSNCP